MKQTDKVKIGKIALIFLVGGILAYAIYRIVTPSVTPDKPEKDETKDYKPETFPLKKGMFGEKIRKVRAVLGLTPSAVFDAELENAIYNKFGVKEIKESDYNFWAQYVVPNV